MIIIFFAVTFAFSWVIWEYARWAFLIGVFAPAIVALGLTYRFEGRAATGVLLRRVVAWDRDWRWYLFALAFMPAVKLTAALIARVSTGAWPQFGDQPIYLMLAALLISTWAQAGEEIGWRGYALPRLARRLGLPLASVLLGVMWALWHLPHFYMATSSLQGQSLPLYVVQVSALSVALSWLYWRTQQSLLLVMLLHAAINNTKDIVPSAGQPMVGRLTAVVLWLAAAFFMWQMKNATLDERRNDGIQLQADRNRPQPVP